MVLDACHAVNLAMNTWNSNVVRCIQMHGRYPTSKPCNMSSCFCYHSMHYLIKQHQLPHCTPSTLFLCRCRNCTTMQRNKHYSFKDQSLFCILVIWTYIYLHKDANLFTKTNWAKTCDHSSATTRCRSSVREGGGHHV